MNILMESKSESASKPSKYKFKTTVSLLMLMATWLADCPAAVDCFLREERHVPYLISQVSSPETSERALLTQGLVAFLLGVAMLHSGGRVEACAADKLREAVRRRVGVETLQAKLEFVSQHELYARTLRTPTFAHRCGRPEQLLFDYEFTRLFKANESESSRLWQVLFQLLFLRTYAPKLTQRFKSGFGFSIFSLFGFWVLGLGILQISCKFRIR